MPSGAGLKFVSVKVGMWDDKGSSNCGEAWQALRLRDTHTNKPEVFPICLPLTHTNIIAMLPNVADIARHAVCPIIDLAKETANALEHPVLILFL